MRARAGRRGFIIDEKRRFSLDLRTGRLDLAGKALAYDPAGVEWHEDDIYVDSRLLEAWLPVALKVDSNAAAIRVEPREELPVQGAWAREQRAGFPSPGAAGDAAKGYPYLPTPYSFVDLPFLDQTATLVSARENDRRRLTANGTTFLTGDLLWMNATGYFNSTSGNLFDNARLDLVRRDPLCGAAGPPAGPGGGAWGPDEHWPTPAGEPHHRPGRARGQPAPQLPVQLRALFLPGQSVAGLVGGAVPERRPAGDPAVPG